MKNDSLFLCDKTEEFYEYSISLGVVPDELLNALYDAEKYLKAVQTTQNASVNVSNTKVYHSI